MTKELSPREKELLADLSSAKRTVKVAAVVELSKISSHPSVFRALQKVVFETDREVSLFATQAVARIQSRIGTKVEIHFTGESLSLDHLTSPLPPEIPALLTFLRQNPQKVAEDLRPAAAEFFGKHGNKDDASFIKGWIEETPALTSLSLLDALETISPKDLVDILPKLLASEHPLLRIRAIKSLHRIDPDEAFAHLSELFASRKAEERVAGISLALVFPFDRIKPMLFAMLNEEKDADVLRAVEVLCISNPEIDCALRLLDLIDVVGKDTGTHITRIFRNICTMLKMTGLATADQANPDHLIATWKKERLQKFMGTLEVQLQINDKSKQDMAEFWLAKNKKNPEVAAFISRLKQNPATEEAYCRLTGEALVKRVSIPAGQNPRSLSTEDKIAFFDQLTPATFPSHEPWIREEASGGEIAVRTAALNALRKYSDDRRLLEVAGKALNEKAPELIMAGLRLLEKIDASQLQDRLPALLANADPLVRGRAIRLILKSDPDKAVATLIHMLQSTDASNRVQATGNLMLVPFERVCKPLLETLRKESLPDIARQILAVFLANPSSKVLDQLDRLQNVVSPAVGMLIAQTRMDLFDLILQFGMETFEPAKQPAPGLLPGAPERETEISPPESGTPAREAPPMGPTEKKGDQTREAAPQEPSPGESEPPLDPPQVKSSRGWAAKPYAISEVRNTIRKREAATRAPAPAVPDEALQQKRLKIGASLLALCFVFLLSVFIRQRASEEYIETGYKNQESEAVDKNAPNYMPSAFRLGAMCRLTGKIEQINEDGSILFSSGGKNIYITFQAKQPTPTGSEPVEIEVLPYRKMANGNYLANGYAFKGKK